MAALTALNEALDASETGVDITPSVTALTRPAYILVESEVMSTSAGTSSLTVIRGAYNTVAASHDTALPVYAVDRVEQRSDSLLVYYYGADGALAAKRIVTPGSATQALPVASGASENDILKINAQGAYELDTPEQNLFDGLANLLYIKEFTVTETAAAGTYSASVAVLSGQRLLDATWDTTATFDGDTAVLDVGRTSDNDAFIDGKNVKTAGRGVMDGTGVIGESAGGQGYKFAADDTIVIALVTTGTGGTTGRLRLVLVLSQATTATATTKA